MDHSETQKDQLVGFVFFVDKEIVDDQTGESVVIWNMYYSEYSYDPGCRGGFDDPPSPAGPYLDGPVIDAQGHHVCDERVGRAAKKAMEADCAARIAAKIESRL